MMDILSVTSEIYPLVKTGGLADVAGALPAVLADHDIAMRTLVPGYPQVSLWRYLVYKISPYM